jgi:hypothetical protein
MVTGLLILILLAMLLMVYVLYFYQPTNAATLLTIGMWGGVWT